MVYTKQYNSQVVHNSILNTIKQILFNLIINQKFFTGIGVFLGTIINNGNLFPLAVEQNKTDIFVSVLLVVCAATLLLPVLS